MTEKEKQNKPDLRMDGEKRKHAIVLLEKLARLGNEPELGNSEGNIIAQKALALLKPCPTCMDSGRMPTFDQASGLADADICPDCPSPGTLKGDYYELPNNNQYRQ